MPIDALLARYAENRDDADFRELADRYSGMVYASALRRTGSREAAEEIVQNVFIALARKADRLKAHPALSGWLHRAAMNEAASYLRREARRRRKMNDYQDHQRVQEELESADAALPCLDEAIDRLPNADRRLILLRFFDRQSYREIGAALGKTEAASRKQAERALAKLGRLLRTRGVALSGAAVATLLGTELAKGGRDGIALRVAKGVASSVAAGGGVQAWLPAFLRRASGMQVAMSACVAVFTVGVAITIAAALRVGDPDADDRKPQQPFLIGGKSETGSGAGTPRKSEEEMMMEKMQLSATPAGICEAARSGDLEKIMAILDENPDLLRAQNPRNWAGLPEMRVYPWASHPVEIAVVFNHPEVVAYLLSVSATEEDPIGGYYEALEIAQKAENQAIVDVIAADVIRRVEERPELITYRNAKGRTLLHYAAARGHFGLMKGLLERGADPGIAANDGVRAIHHVAGDNPQTRLLLEHGIEYDLWVAASVGDLDRARAILAEDPTQVAVDFYPASFHSNGMPLVAACINGHLGMARLLLDHGADVDGQLPGRKFGDKGYGLIEAFSAGHLDIVHLLLDRGADMEAWVDSNWDFKTRVRKSDNQELKDRVLTKEEQDPPVRSPSFEAWTGRIVGNIRELPPPTPEEALGRISAAIVSHNRDHHYSNYKEIITVMLEQGADQNAWMNPTEEQKEKASKRYWHREFGTPLHWLSTAYLNKHNYSHNPDIPTVAELVDLAALFLEFDADIEARHPISNHTPLSSAVEKGIREYVDFLLENGAAVHDDDPPETNPIAIAERLGFADILTRLRQNG